MLISQIATELAEKYARDIDEHIRLLLPQWFLWLPKLLWPTVNRYILKIEIRRYIDAHNNKTEIWQKGQLKYSLSPPALKIF